MARKPKTCLCGECGEVQYSRGLSRGCYASARRRVVSGETTWAALVAAGCANEAQKKGRPTRPIGVLIDRALAAG